VRSSAERSPTPAATAVARCSAVRAPAEAEVFFAAAPSIAEGRAGAAEGPSPEVVLAAGATWGAAGVGVCTAAPVEAFAEAAETRAVSAATEEPCIAGAGEQFTTVGAFVESAHHFVEAVAHFAVAAQAAVPASAVGSDGRHRVSLPRDAAADRGERGEDLTRTDVRFAVEQLDFME